ncbi:probable serine/threonine-protein kinase WNK6 [Spinacia oleracea]|uniref:non-specific serine/threonine protein kinase n=1 Tax=Spinacia oleracea TaxID=3562 RepID=A0A9R0JAU9_SPIOL|nr:probable serine/threonine-protein kinase WNK6 [Spinacia oleracea]
MASSSSSSPPIANPRIIETDPTGKYVRYGDILGVGYAKTVYSGFDKINGKEIAWSRIIITERMINSEDGVYTQCAEACLLKELNHESIVKFYHSWIDYKNKIVNIITELFTSVSLRHYIQNHVLVDLTAVKNWSRQILQGLHYLHNRNTPILHRDVKIENIFVNGNSGTVKLGDFGLAMLLEPGYGAIGRVGTAQYMAPEIFRGNYNQLVDIHAFGICVLQMVTGVDHLYKECKFHQQIMTKIRLGVKPEALSTVTDPLAKKFIKRCLAPAFRRPSAIDLLNDPFLAPSVAGSSTVRTNSSLMPCSVRDQVDGLLGVTENLDELIKDQVQGGVRNQNLNTGEDLNVWNLFGEKPVLDEEFFDAKQSLEDQKMPSCFGKLTKLTSFIRKF